MIKYQEETRSREVIMGLPDTPTFLSLSHPKNKINAMLKSKLVKWFQHSHK